MKRGSRSKMISISAIEANLLLYALDAYTEVDDMGQVQVDLINLGYSKKEVQELRDKLLGAHKHK